MEFRYTRHGKCNRCGACCLVEEPKCPHLEIKDGVATCLIFGKPERFERCWRYPEMPPTNFNSCGYYFWDTEEKKFVRDKL